MYGRQPDDIREVLIKRTLAWSKYLCLVAMAFPVLAAVGWVFNIELLERVHHSLPVMEPNTALGLITAAIAVFLTNGDPAFRRCRMAAFILAMLVSFLGLLTLGEYMFGWDLGIDRILIGGGAITAGHYPARPSPQTSANLAVLGASVLAYNVRRFPIRLGQIGALAAGANAIVAMTGYIFNASTLYGSPSLGIDVGMAIHAAAGFILLSLALLCSRPSEGMMALVTSDTRSSHMARRILLTGSVAPPVVGVLTRIGVLVNWYDVGVQASLFVVVLAVLLLRTTWQAARQSEGDELRARAALTERQRLEEELRLSEAKSSGILSISPDAIISIDENQIITLFNEGAQNIFGYSGEEAIGAPLDKLIPEHLRANHRNYIREFIAGKDSARRMGERRAVIRGRRKNGEEFHADAAISKLKVGGKRIITVAVRDITEQKRVENEQRFLAEVGAILTSTLDYDDTLNNIAKLVVRDLADFCIVDTVEEDGMIKRLKVMSRDASKKQVCDQLMQVRLDSSRRHLISPVLETKRSVCLEHISSEMMSSVSQNEEELRILIAVGVKSVIAVPLLAHGKLVGVIVLISSSASRLYRAADVRLAEELALRAALAIANAKLFGDVQNAAKTREDVLAVVSHDLKNPVATMSLVGHVLRQFERLEGRKLNEFADKIQRAVSRMQSLIADLLDFAKMENGTFSVNAKTGDLSQSVIPAVDSMRALAEAKQQTIDVDWPQNLPCVTFDGDRIGQVISNLLGNAIKFTPDDGAIRISAHQESEEVVVSIVDTGPGIPREHLSKIFDWFWQVKETKQAGSGLGLSIAKGIIDAHGGRIWAESELGKGSSFCFSLGVADLSARSMRSA